jgi:hypothetical protein
MSKKVTFQEELRKTIIERMDPKLSRKEVLIDIFKTYTAKMMEQNVMANKNRMNADYVTMLKGYMINEFRNTSLGEWQLPEKEYSKLFDQTMKEIFDHASAAHAGEDKVVKSKEQQVEVKRPSRIIIPPGVSLN